MEFPAFWVFCLLFCHGVLDTTFHNGKGFLGFRRKHSRRLREAGRSEHPWPQPTGATPCQTRLSQQHVNLCRSSKSMAAPLNPPVFSLLVQITNLFLFPSFAFHILWPHWDDLKPENMESSMQMELQTSILSMLGKYPI